jgi:type II secretory pathway pseudopilin PulG
MINKHSRGFTITELLIYMGIFTILLVVLTEIFVATLNVQLETEASSSVEQDSKFMLARMIYDIQKASKINTPASLGDQGDTLSLEIDGTTYISSSPNGTDLELNGNKLNSFDTTISNVIFQRLGNPGGVNSIKIGFTVSSKVQRASGPEIKNVQTTVGLRPN